MVDPIAATRKPSFFTACLVASLIGMGLGVAWLVCAAVLRNPNAWFAFVVAVPVGWVLQRAGHVAARSRAIAAVLITGAICLPGRLAAGRILPYLAAADHLEEEYGPEARSSLLSSKLGEILAQEQPLLEFADLYWLVGAVVVAAAIAIWPRER